MPVARGMLCLAYMPVPIPRPLARFVILGLGIAVGSVERGVPTFDRDTLLRERESLFDAMRAELLLSESQMDAVRGIFSRSSVLGQGNPAISVHPMTREECSNPCTTYDDRGPTNDGHEEERTSRAHRGG